MTLGIFRSLGSWFGVAADKLTYNMRFFLDTGMRVWFDVRVPNTLRITTIECSIPREDWVKLGSPKELTITVEPKVG